MIKRLVPLLLLLPLFAACGPGKNEFAPACPNPAFMKDLSDLVRYRPGSQGYDLTDLDLRARLVGLQGRCELGSDAFELVTTISVQIEMMRGPAMPGRIVQVPIFVAVVENGEILNKQMFPVIFEFPSNVDRATIGTPSIQMVLPISPEKSGAAYGLIAGFQLTPEEREVARRRGGF